MSSSAIGLIVFSIFVISGIQALRVHSIAHTIEFILFSFVFFLIGIDSLFVFGIFSSTIMDDLTFFIYMGIVYQLLYKVRQKNHKGQILFFWTIFIFAIILDSFELTSMEFMTEQLVNLSYLLNDILLLYVGIDYFITYKNIKMAYSTKKTQIAKQTWMFTAVIMMGLGISRGSLYLIKLIQVIFNITILRSINLFISTSSIIVEFAFTFFALIFVMSIFFLPEMLMITRPQIVSIMKLYSTSKKSEDDNHPREISKIFLHDVIDYLEEVKNSKRF